MTIIDILQKAVDEGASDVFIVAGLGLSFRKNGVIILEEDTRLMPPDTEKLVREIYELADNRDISHVLKKGDDDFALAVPHLSRFRVSAYKQRGSLSAVIRVISFRMPDPEAFSIPKTIIDLGNQAKGMVLVTGPAGSGKSTTLACIIDAINRNRASHIITLEDPIEYLHRHVRSIVSQREIDVDTESYVTALRAALRQSPDVILLGEMRDYETISVAMTAAETGHLLFSTLHTIGAASTINRIMDVFPAEQQHQISVQLSSVLSAVVSQQLLPTKDGTVVPAFEILIVTPAIRNMIREKKVYQIDGFIQSSGGTMISMDTSIMNLYREGKITKETAIGYASNPEMLSKRLM